MNEAQSLEARVDRLECVNRRLISTIASLVLLLVVLATAGFLQSAEREITAETFIVVDREGNRRAVLSSQSGEAGLLLLDERGTARATFVATNAEAQLSLLDAQASSRLMLTANAEGSYVTHRDARGSVRASLSMVEADQGAALRILDAQGTVRAAVAFWPQVGPGVVLFDERGQPSRTLY